ncbi:MAG: hypothetical protein R3D68_13815 [Hyphomicrobiaceae bacterium]
MIDFTRKLLELARATRDWAGAIADAGTERRERVARYADQIVGTLARAIAAFECLEKEPGDKTAARIAIKELARLTGYVESLVAVLEGRIDGRRVHALKRRLEGLACEGLIVQSIRRADTTRIERLSAAEGYFRALADELRA